MGKEKRKGMVNGKECRNRKERKGKREYVRKRED